MLEQHRSAPTPKPTNTERALICKLSDSLEHSVHASDDISWREISKIPLMLDTRAMAAIALWNIRFLPRFTSGIRGATVASKGWRGGA